MLSQEATAEAQRSAEEIARVQGLGVVQPVLTDKLLQGESASLAEMDRVVRSSVLDARTVRVKIWDASGRIVYSDESRLIGQTFPLGLDEQDALRSNLVDSGVSDLSRPENRFERPFGHLLEVYLPLKTPSGNKVLFETYQEFASVEAQQSRMMLEVGPVLLVGRRGRQWLGLMLTSKDHDRDAADEARWGRRWMDVGSGGWDRQGRPSEVRLDRLLELDESGVRREGAALPRPVFDRVVVAGCMVIEGNVKQAQIFAKRAIEAAVKRAQGS